MVSLYGNQIPIFISVDTFAGESKTTSLGLKSLCIARKSSPIEAHSTPNPADFTCFNKDL